MIDVFFIIFSLLIYYMTLGQNNTQLIINNYYYGVTRDASPGVPANASRYEFATLADEEVARTCSHARLEKEQVVHSDPIESKVTPQEGCKGRRALETKGVSWSGKTRTAKWSIPWHRETSGTFLLI